MAARKENKFYVFKKQDVLDLMRSSEEFKDAYSTVELMLQDHRKKAGKDPWPDYIVCNQDEPYAERVWQEILRGEDEKAGLPVHEPRKDAMRAVAIALKLHEAIPAELSCTHGDCNELRELAEIQARNQEL